MSAAALSGARRDDPRHGLETSDQKLAGLATCRKAPAPVGVKIEAIVPVERTARALQAPQLALANSLGEDGNNNAMKDQS